MNAVLKIFLSMSCSGGLLILLLLSGKRFWREKISRQWQYYIWLVVVLRLLLPFGPEVNPLGRLYQAAGQAISQAASLPPQQPMSNTPDDVSAPAAGLEQSRENASPPAADLTAARPLQEIGTLLAEHVWLVWLAAALGLLIRKITIYQGFIRYIKAGLNPVSDIEMLDRLSIASEQAGIQKPVELCVNPLISSPLLIGFFHPCIVLPSADIPEKNLQYTVLHELTHYKRRDMFYKWLIQITVCLHWFNPLVHLMSREIAKACEFSCDEAVLVKIGGGSAQEYGKTLLDAMAAVGKYKENLGSVTLSENKQLLKERLGAIMNFKRKSTAIRLLTGVLTLCVILGAVFAGPYPSAAAADQTPGRPQAPVLPDEKGAPPTGAEKDGTPDGKYALMVEKAYEANSLPLFQMAFLQLDEAAQSKWLDRIYKDNRIAFWGAAIGLLDEDCALLQRCAEKTYEDGSIAYFSALAMHMSGDTLEKWLDKALEDEKWVFQSVLFNALDRDDEFDGLKEAQEKEWAAAQIAEYEAAGVAMDGRDYYYKGQLVNIFLDIRQPDQSFCTLNMNPKGAVNIKIVRDKNNKITGVEYLTGAEAAELLEEPFGDISNDPDGGFDGWDSDWDDKFDDWLDETQKAEYEAAGVTVDGKNCYYKGQLARIFLDTRPNNYYTLNRNPNGTVDIKIVRDGNSRITDVEYLTAEEVTELFGNMDGAETIAVNLKTVAAGEAVFLGEYSLSEGDRIWYDISAETGSRMHVFFAGAGQEDAVYWSVNNRRQKDEPLRCCAEFTVEPPAASSGTYRLYLRALDGALGNVTGGISIEPAADAS